MSNQMIALQARSPQLPDPSRQTAQFANMMNMARQQEAAALQAQRARQEMQYAEAAEGRAVAGEKRDVEKFGAEQPARVASALGAGLVGILHNPSNETIMQVGQTFASVGMEQDKFGPILKQIQDIPDPNARKLFVMQFISQSEPARAALKFVMPEVKSEKVGDATVFYDANPASSIMGQELFRFTAAPEPDELNQQVVGDRVFNINPRTGVAAEAPIGDPNQGLARAARETTFTSSGVRSPYAVGGGMGAGQPSITPPVAPQGITPPAPAVGGPRGGPAVGAPGMGGDTFSRMIQQESRGKQFDRNGRPLTSSAGAIGIAQVMPGTAPEAAKLAGLPFDQTRYRNDPEYNLALGKAYYEKQLRDFGGNEQLAAAAYNAGPGAVRSALKKGGPDGWINNVPLETRKYIRNVFGGAGAPTRTGAGTPTGAGTGTPVTVSEAVKLPGKRRVSSLVADMLKEYDKLNNAKAIGSSGRGVAENIFDYLSVSAPGQEIQKMFGTKANDSLSNLTSSRKLLASAMAAAMGLSSKQADSNTELQLTLASLSDATQGYKAVTDILKRVDREYGMGTASTRTPTTGGAQGKGKPPLKSFRRK